MPTVPVKVRARLHAGGHERRGDGLQPGPKRVGDRPALGSALSKTWTSSVSDGRQPALPRTRPVRARVGRNSTQPPPLCATVDHPWRITAAQFTARRARSSRCGSVPCLRGYRPRRSRRQRWPLAFRRRRLDRGCAGCARIRFTPGQPGRSRLFVELQVAQHDLAASPTRSLDDSRSTTRAVI
jgi:hypothetical protein